MKIDVDLDGMEVIEDYSYVYSRDVFRKGSLYYKFKSSCSICGESFFMRLSYPTDFCGKKCAAESDLVKSKISAALTGTKCSEEHKAKMSIVKSKGGVVKLNLPLYDTYNKQVSIAEETRRKGNLLEVRCSLCKNWFVPKRTSVEARAQYIKGNTNREGRLYCSDSCRHNCPIFNKHKYPIGKNPRKSRNVKHFTESELRIWASEVLKRANYMCEYCGSAANTAHHIIPKKLEPMHALDPDNGLACCNSCHYTYGHSGSCSSINISKINCDH